MFQRQYPAGQIVLLEGAASSVLYVVQAGRLKLFKTSSRGREQVLRLFFFSSRRRHTRSVSAFLLNRSSDLKLAPSVCRMTFPILASLLVRLVVLLPFQLLRLSLATPSRWTPLALSVFLHCVVALLLTLL